MKQYSQLSIVVILMAMIPIISMAQIKNAISVEYKDIHRNEQKIIIKMDILVQDINIPSNEYITITPTLKGKDEVLKELPVILLNGKNSQKRYNRSQKLSSNKQNNIYSASVLSDNKQNTSIPYRVEIPYEEWLDNAEIDLVGATCDCRKQPEQFIVSVGRLTPPVFPSFVSTLIVPPVEIKKQELNGEAFITFPVNKTNLIPELGNNTHELNVIRSTFNSVQSEKDVLISSISIEAYSSPEGHIDNNLKLAEGRAIALKDYIMASYKINPSIISAKAKGENWDGLAEAINNQNLTETQKQDILNIIKINDPETRKIKLKAYNGGAIYRQLLKDVYPSLRKSIYKINYIIPAFTNEKVKELLNTKPGMLSLNEIYTVAKTYDKKSKEFKDIIDLTTHLYPKDAIVNMNAAALELNDNKSDKIQKHLSEYIQDKRFYNNIAIMYALDKNYTDAKRFFEMAIANGDENAKENLKRLATYIDQVN